MALSELQLVWLDFDQQRRAVDECDPNLLRWFPDVFQLQFMGLDSWTWSHLGSLGGNILPASPIQGPSSIPQYGDKGQLVSCMALPPQASHQGFPSQYPGAPPAYLHADMTFHDMLDPALLGNLPHTPTSATFFVDDHVMALHGYNPDTNPHNPTAIDQDDHLTIEMTLAEPFEQVRHTNEMKVPLANEAPVSLNTPMAESGAETRFAREVRHLPFPRHEVAPTPTNVQPGVYEVFGPRRPRDLVPRAVDRAWAPPSSPARRGNEYATHTQPWGCNLCGTGFMTELLLEAHKLFHKPQPPMHELENPAFQGTYPYSEEIMRRASEQNQRHSTRFRCENGEWTSFKQSMHGFGDDDDDESGGLGSC